MRLPAVNIRPHMSVDGRDHFTPERIWKDNKGHVLYQRLEPRASFADDVVQTPWDQLQRLYFVSYTLWNYFNTPFLLTQPGFEVSELESHEENWRCLHVRFPASVPTHCSEQILFFNQKGLLQRLDYAPEVVASTPVSHYCFDHQTFSRLIFPTLRRVAGRTGAIGPTVTVLQIADVVVAPDQSSQVWLRIKWINAKWSDLRRRQRRAPRPAHPATPTR